MSSAEFVLVACDRGADGQAIREALSSEFANVQVCEEADRAIEDFDRVAPDVLVLAHHTVADAERYYLGLFRRSKIIGTKPHRTILLCNRDEVVQAYEECRNGRFDDYVVYWPVMPDPPRLLMAVHLAIRSLNLASEAATQHRIAQIARQLDALTPEVDRALAENGTELRRVDQSLKSLSSGLASAMHDASNALADQLMSMPGASGVVGDVRRYLQRLNDDHVRPHIAATSALLEPALAGFDRLSNVYRTGLESARKIARDARRGATLLIVEDEATQRQVYKHLLGTRRYTLKFAATASDAMRIALRSPPPDLIVMDIELPDASGLDLTRQLKAHPALSDVPVVMITGHRERKYVIQSREVGAVDFLIKPFTPKTFMQKLERHLKDVLVEAA